MLRNSARDAGRKCEPDLRKRSEYVVSQLRRCDIIVEMKKHVWIGYLFEFTERSSRYFLESLESLESLRSEIHYDVILVFFF